MFCVNDIRFEFDKQKNTVNIINPDSYSDFFINNSSKIRELIFNTIKFMTNSDKIKIKNGGQTIEINNIGEIVISKKASDDNYIKKYILDLKNKSQKILNKKPEKKFEIILKNLNILNRAYEKALEDKDIEKRLKVFSNIELYLNKYKNEIDPVFNSIFKEEKLTVKKNKESNRADIIDLGVLNDRFDLLKFLGLKNELIDIENRFEKDTPIYYYYYKKFTNKLKNKIKEKKEEILDIINKKLNEIYTNEETKKIEANKIIKNIENLKNNKDRPYVYFPSSEELKKEKEVKEREERYKKEMAEKEKIEKNIIDNFVGDKFDLENKRKIFDSIKRKREKEEGKEKLSKKIEIFNGYKRREEGLINLYKKIYKNLVSVINKKIVIGKESFSFYNLLIAEIDSIKKEAFDIERMLPKEIDYNKLFIKKESEKIIEELGVFKNKYNYVYKTLISLIDKYPLEEKMLNEKNIKFVRLVDNMTPSQAIDYIKNKSNQAKEYVKENIKKEYNIGINNLDDILGSIKKYINDIKKVASLNIEMPKKEDVKNSIDTIEGFVQKNQISDPSLEKSIDMLKKYFIQKEENSMEKKSLDLFHSLIKKIAKEYAFEEIDVIKKDLEKAKVLLKKIMNYMGPESKRKIYEIIKDIDSTIYSKSDKNIDKKSEDMSNQKTEVVTPIRSGDAKKDFEDELNKSLSSGKNKEQAISDAFKKVKQMGYKVEAKENLAKMQKFAIGDKVWLKEFDVKDDYNYGIVIYVNPNNVIVDWGTGVPTEECPNNLIKDNFNSEKIDIKNIPTIPSNVVIKNDDMVSKAIQKIPFKTISMMIKDTEDSENSMIIVGKKAKIKNKENGFSLVMYGEDIKFF